MRHPLKAPRTWNTFPIFIIITIIIFVFYLTINLSAKTGLKIEIFWWDTLNVVKLAQFSPLRAGTRPSCILNLMTAPLYTLRGDVFFLGSQVTAQIGQGISGYRKLLITGDETLTLQNLDKPRPNRFHLAFKRM
jgi:hypothetical protein